MGILQRNWRSSLGKVLLGLISALCLMACSNDYYAMKSGEDEGILSLDMGTSPMSASGIPASFLDDMQLMLSYRGGVDEGNFAYKLFGVTHLGSTLSSRVRSGNWYLTMVVPQKPSSLRLPQAGQALSGQLMYEYTPSVAGGKSTPADEIYFRHLALPAIVEDQTATLTNVSIARNVAMIQVYVERVRNISPAATQTIRLKNVPAKLSWGGELLPSKSDPAVLADPLEGKLNFKRRDGGTFSSDTMTFIIPAHRGKDFLLPDGTLNPNPQDLTSQRMTLEMNITGGDGQVVKVEKELPTVARCNQILRVKLRLDSLDLLLSCDFTAMPDWTEVVSDDPNLH